VTKVVETVHHTSEFDILAFTTALSANASCFTQNHDMLVVKKEKAIKILPYLRVEKSRPLKFYGRIKEKKREYDLKIEREFANNIKEGDYFLYPQNRQILHKEFLDVTSFWTRNNFGPYVEKIEKIKINKEFMWLAGFYVAEGSTYRGGIKFSISSVEKEYADKIVKIIKKLFNKKAKLFYPKSRTNSLEVTISSTNLEHIFKKLFGTGAENKHYPFWFNFLKTELKESLFNGLMDGDGCYTSNTYDTISPTLADEVVDLAIALNKIPSCRITEAYSDKKNLNRRKSYSIYFKKRESIESFYEEIDGINYLFIKVKNIKNIGREKLVYDITVEDKTHTFLSNHFAVGNCGVGGDSIKFVMELEKLSYPEAVEKLASMNNFSLSYTKGSSDYSDAKRVLESVGKWYVKNLNQNPIATQYLQQRGISSRAIEKFDIGYVPNSKEVMTFLQSNLLPLPQAIEAGVVAQSDNGGGFYARLVERITFPIHSTNGALVGFGGRTITNHPAKYINSPQTKLFNKSRLLYGYHLAKESIYKNKKIIICEGYLDVVMFHQAGFTQAVASMGTALTTEHIPLLRKGEPKVILAYDGDKAGVNAGLKASEMLSIAGVDGGVVLFPNGQDPADLIANGQSEMVANLLRDAKPLITFVLEMTASSYDLNDPRAKESAFGAMQHFLSQLSPIIKDAYIPFASSLLGLNPSFFGNSGSNMVKKERLSEGKDDVAHLSIIKTLIEHPEFIDTVLSVMQSSMFGKYEGLFKAVIKQEKENSALVGLSIDENFQTLDEEGLSLMLLQLATIYYEIRLKNITRDTTLSSSKKVFLIKKIKFDVLARLKKGELVPFNIA